MEGSEAVDAGVDTVDKIRNIYQVTNVLLLVDFSEVQSCHINL